MCPGFLTHRAATLGRKQLTFFLLSLGLFLGPSMVLAQQAPQVLEIEGLGKAKVELEGKWQYHPGDDPQWADPRFDDASWPQVDVGSLFDQGVNYAPFFWYRRRLVLDRQDPAQPLAVNLNAGDTFGVYWNGREIGHRGEVPPNFDYPYPGEAAFDLPLAGATKSSGVLAVRVWCQFPSTIAQPCGILEPSSIGAVIVQRESIASERSRVFSENYPSAALLLLQLLGSALALLTYLRGNRQIIYLWFSLIALAWACYQASWFIDLYLPQNWATGLETFTAGAVNALFLPLFLWLLGLEKNNLLRRLVYVLALLVLVNQAFDAILTLFWAQAGRGVSLADAISTYADAAMKLGPVPLLAFAFFRGVWRRNWPLVLAASLSVFYRNLSTLNNTIIPGIIPGKLACLCYKVQVGDFKLFFADTPGLLLILALAFSVMRRFLEDRRRQQQVESELQSAREVQQVLVPEQIPAIPGYVVASVYRPASEVGGDFFQILPLPEGGALLAIGDVSGKGMKAAMIVSLIVGTLRTVASYTQQPTKILEELNARLYGRMAGGFVTCLVMRISAEKQIIVANAGHLPPYINGNETAMTGSLPLGLIAEATYEQTALFLADGDTLTLVTDGVIEAQNANKELFGFERLSELLSMQPPAERIVEAACDFGQQDDITVLTIHRLGETVPAAGATLSLITQLA